MSDNSQITTVGQIITPAGVRRRINRLWQAWLSLLKVEPKAGPEAGAYLKWAKSVFSNWTDQIFATGTLDELDRWQDSYRLAWEAAGKPAAALNPAAIDKEPSVNWWIVLGLAVVGYLILREFNRP